MFILNVLYYIIILLATVTIHELSHVLAAKLFGLKVEKIKFTLLGEIAIVHDLVFLQTYEKYIVLIAGPAANLIVGLVCLPFSGEIVEFVRNINFAICVFNLIPVNPFDGAKIFGAFLDNKIGVLSSNNVVFSLSRGLSVLLVILGFVQVILYPFNISLLSIGVYTFNCNKKVHFDTTFDFYKNLVVGKDKYIKRKVLQTKILIVTEDLSLKKIINTLNYEYYYIFCILSRGKIDKIVTESEICEHILSNGVNGQLQNLFK